MEEPMEDGGTPGGSIQELQASLWSLQLLGTT